MASIGSLNLSFATNVAALQSDMAKAARAVNQSTNRMNTAMASAASKARLFSAAIGAVVGVLSMRKLARAADEFTEIGNRLKVVTESTSEFNVAFADVARIARDTQSSLAATTTSYSRMAIATKQMGLSQTELGQLVESLNNTFRISGSNSTEAAQAAVQLAQGLGAGALRGDEFRSVSEANVVLLDLLAQKLGVTRGALKDMAAAGKLTADLVGGVLIENFEALKTKAAVIAPTLERTFTVLKDQFKVGFFTTTQKDFEAASAAIATLGSDAERLGRLMGKAAVEALYLTGRLIEVGKTVASVFGGFDAFELAVMSVVRAFDTLFATIEAGAAMAQRNIVDLEIQLRKSFNVPIPQHIQQRFEEHAVAAKTAQDRIARNIREQGEQQKAVFAGTMDEYRKGADQIRSMRAEYDREQVALNEAMMKASGRSSTAGTGSGGAFSDAAKKEADRIKGVIDQLRFRNEQLAYNSRWQEINNELRQAGVQISSAEGLQIANLVNRYHDFTEAQDRAREKTEQLKRTTDALGESFNTAFEAAVAQGEKLSTVLRKLAADVLQVLVNQATGGNGGIGGLIASGLTSVLSGGFGGFRYGGATDALGANVVLDSMPKFASGGISKGPSIFGEAGPEAAVPLPDGRRIPVDLGGGSGSGVRIDYIDARGADQQAIARIHQMIADLRADVPAIAIGATADKFSRSNSYLRR
jgi:tape measure domain-containing protein